ncbi:unnamed protein product [Protopolystoma xenopodis]|uniref:Glycosyl transferase family 3 domain-containing protein n=1 Tax=Protopolystoma xenopodis TaxID=117903 RepID=A0A3S5AWJ9_9PLAT|nr:unnamed protein product [Protopolystoma xenopodis]
MISGRGLGITGGTLDKLESIPGYQIQLNEKKMHELIQSTGLFIVGQTQHMVPADRVLYSIRDITGSVKSDALITGKHVK